MSIGYRTYAQLAQDIRRWEPHLPPLSAVIGVPRSGLVPAAMLATLRHIPVIPIESLRGDSPAYRPAVSRTLHPVDGPVLVLDDTCNAGRTIREVRSALSGANVIFGAVYATAHTFREGLLDVAGYRLSEYHSCEWNLFRTNVARTLLTDFDGVLCQDWHGGRLTASNRPEYERWLDTVPPLAPVTHPLYGIITGRTERYRPQTVAWLKRHGIEYEHLVMVPDDGSFTGTADRFKSIMYRKLSAKASAFVESCPIQSARIAKATGFAVLCYPTGELHNATETPPFWK